MPLNLLKYISDVIFSDLWGNNPENQDPKKDPRLLPPKNPNKGENLSSDIDKYWRSFSNRLDRLFSKKGSGSEPDPSLRGIGSASLLFICILIGIWLLTGLFFVPEGYLGVKTTFGKYTKMETKGLGWCLPAPIQRVEMLNVSKERELKLGFRTEGSYKQPKSALMLTGDQNLLNVQIIVYYTIKDPKQWYLNNNQQEGKQVSLGWGFLSVETDLNDVNKDGILAQAAESVVREEIGKNTSKTLLSEDKNNVLKEIKAKIQNVFDEYETGVQLKRVVFKEIGLPEVLGETKSELTKIKKENERLIQEAKIYAENALPKAKEKAAQIKKEANDYSLQALADAQSDITKFKILLEEYKQSPTVTRDRLYVDTMKKIFSRTTNILIDTPKTGATVSLSLDKNSGRLVNKSSKSEDSIAQNPASNNSESDKDSENKEILSQKQENHTGNVGISERDRDSRDSRDRESR